MTRYDAVLRRRVTTYVYPCVYDSQITDRAIGINGAKEREMLLLQVLILRIDIIIDI